MMAEPDACIGICFTEHQLLYAINKPDEPNALVHIGCVDFNFDIRTAVSCDHIENIAGIEKTILDIKSQYQCNTIRMLLPAVNECWTLVPRSVYEEPEEREPCLDVLMNGTPRKNLHSTWFRLANQDYKFLLIRRNNIIKRYSKLISEFANTEYLSEFELGAEWQLLTNVNGSFMTVHCQHDYIAIASYLFGKLRGSTYLTYDSISDIPFLWKYHSRHISWLDGIHDQVYVYGSKAPELLDIQSTIWYDADDILLMNSLSKMKVSAEEKTYSFDLGKAFPAVMLSLNLDSKQVQLNQR